MQTGPFFLKALCFLAISLGLSNAHAQRIHVDSASTAASPNGSTWATAYPDLQAALDVASAGDSIWVAKGTYFPADEFDADDSGGSDPREATFYLDKNIVLLGGYPTGGGPRDHAANPTILSGDLGTPGDADNAYHVMVIDGTTSNGNITLATEVDGFTVAGGNADGSSFNVVGGGIYVDGSGSGKEASPTLTHCTFSHNSARSGGAIYNDGTNSGTSSPELTHCSFSQNSAGSFGGAIYNDGTNSGTSSPELTHCSFSQNSANSSGGAILNAGFQGTSSPVLTHCSFSQNSALFGGAISNDGTNSGTSSPELTHCSFSQNSAGNSGGAIFNDGFQGTSSPQLANCILWHNKAGSDSTSFAAQIFENNGSQSTLTYSLANGLNSGPGNLSADPLFVDAPAGDLRLLACSPAIDAGNNASLPAGVTEDLAGNPRTVNTTVDMGAFEFQGSNAVTSLYVDSSVVASGNGQSWATAFKTLAEALSPQLGCSVDTIKVARGTYFPADEFDADGSGGSDPREATFHLDKNIVLLGGYPTGGGPRDHAANPTILSGDLGTPGDSTDNAYHVMYIDGTTANGNITAATEVDGFTVTGGNADVGFSINASGGGIYVDGSGSGNEASPALTHCSFSQNSAFVGGAIYNFGFQGTSSPVLTNCSFSQNRAQSGGAIYNNGTSGTSSPVLTHCSFSQNRAQSGGAIYNNGTSGTSSPELTNCSFSQNNAGIAGGAIANVGRFGGTSSPALTNCSFSQNSAFAGGAIYNNVFQGTSSPALTNCSFSQNSALFGGAISNDGFQGTSSPQLANCILWHNKAGSDSTSFAAQIFENNGSQSTLTYSLANGLNSGPGNLSADPLFVDAPAGDLRLLACSPAIDAGNNASLPAGVTEDLAGNSRTVNTTVDMGAFEFQGALPQLTISCIGDTTVYLNASGALSFDLVSNLIDTTGCSPLTLAFEPNATLHLDCNDVGSPRAARIIVSDFRNTKDSCNFHVTVADTIAPTAQCSTQLNVQLSATGTASIMASDIDNGSSDACGIASRTVSPGSFDCDDVGANTVTLRITDNNGNLDSCTTRVTVTGKPELVVSPPAYTGCTGTAFFLNRYVSDANGLATQYAFYTAAPGVQAAFASVPATSGSISPYNPVRVVPSASTTYWIVGTAPSGCSDTAMLTINVSATQTLQVPGPITAISGQTVAVPPFGPGGLTFVWQNNNLATGLGFFGYGNIAPFRAAAVVAPTTSTVTVYGIGASCPTLPGSFTITVSPNANVRLGAVEQKGLLAYPNPFTDHLTIVRDDALAQAYSVIDITGKIVRTGALPQDATAHRIELGQLAAGVYTLRVGGEAVRIVKE